MSNLHPQIRWLQRYGLPLTLMAVGWWLWRFRVPVPGAPVVVPELGVNEVSVNKVGNLYMTDVDNHCVWMVNRWGKVERIAGCGKEGYSGDKGQAAKARLGYPSGVAFDVEGTLYIPDFFSDCIRKVNRQGVITTMAGNGQRGYSGDGRTATQASLAHPLDVVFDAEGNLYVADSENNRVRKVDRAGLITTVAGSGRGGFSGDGGQAVRAQLNSPEGVAFDTQGNLYIADWGNHRVRKVDKAGTLTTVAGNGKEGYSGDGGQAVKAQLSCPADVTFDAQGNLYIADEFNHCIRKVDKTGIITTVAGNGKEGYSGDGKQAIKARLALPLGITFDAKGDLYIADSGNNRVRKVNKSGIITTVITDKPRFSK